MKNKDKSDQKQLELELSVTTLRISHAIQSDNIIEYRDFCSAQRKKRENLKQELLDGIKSYAQKVYWEY